MIVAADDGAISRDLGPIAPSAMGHQQWTA
jgi:hypothetical protein